MTCVNTKALQRQLWRLPVSRLRRSDLLSELLIEPIENASIEEGAVPHLAMRAGAFPRGKAPPRGLAFGSGTCCHESCGPGKNGGPGARQCSYWGIQPSERGSVVRFLKPGKDRDARLHRLDRSPQRRRDAALRTFVRA
jgi:hypothetical protein